MSDSSIWRDLSEIRFGYVLLIGACLVGGAIYRVDVNLDGEDLQEIEEVRSAIETYQNESRDDPHNGFDDQDFDGNDFDRGDFDELKEELREKLIENQKIVHIDVGKNTEVNVQRNIHNVISAKKADGSDIFDFVENADFSSPSAWGEISSIISQGVDDWEARLEMNRTFIATLDNGMAMEDVLEKLGPPDYSRKFDHDVDILMYRTRDTRNDLMTTVDETSPLVFQNQRLVGLSESDDWADSTWKNANTETFKTDQANNAIGISKIEENQNRDEIVAMLGRPDFVDIPAESFEILSYRTHSESLDGFTSRDESTSLLLKDGVLLAKSIDEN